MVKITQEMLLKFASHSKKRSNESNNQYLKRLTHVYFQERNIDEIVSVQKIQLLKLKFCKLTYLFYMIVSSLLLILIFISDTILFSLSGRII